MPAFTQRTSMIACFSVFFFCIMGIMDVSRDCGLDQYDTDLTNDLLGLFDTHVSFLAIQPANCLFHCLISQLRFSNLNERTEPFPHYLTMTQVFS